jgi:hypothetical protein
MGAKQEVMLGTQLQFTTRIVKSGSKPVCVIPIDPNQVWGEKTQHHVSGTINGCAFRGTLEPEKNGYFLKLGAAWLRDNGLGENDEVEVVMAPEGPQVENVAEDVARALQADEQAQTFFDGLPTFYRKNYIRWIESAKRPETRRARIAAMVELLKEGKRER